MSDPLTEARDDYLAMLAGWIPFSRAFSYLIFLLAIIAVDQGVPDGIFSAIASLKLSRLFSAEVGLIWESTIFQLLLALGMLVILGYLHHGLKFVFFNAFAKIRDPSTYMQSMKSNGDVIPANTASQRDDKKAQRLDNHVKRRSKELARRNSISEILLAIFLIPIFLYSQSNILDAALAIASIVGVTLLQWNMFLFYVSRFLPTIIVADPPSAGLPIFGEGHIDDERDMWRK